MMPILGSHLSISGGYHRAVESARACGCDCVQIFTKSNAQWRAKPITSAEAALFQEKLRELKVSHPLSHSSYLINLASPNDELWKKSIAAFVVELKRASQLGVPYVVLHPGAYTTSSEAEGLERIVAALNAVHEETEGIESQCLLETTAGKGSDLGWRFEHLAEILGRVAHPDRLGVCVDTCHIFAAGYPLGTAREFKATFREFDKLIGLERIRAFHLNDCQKQFGSRRDRHEHIGRGYLGLEPFRHLLNDRRFRKIPMYLETAKGMEQGEDLDVINLRTLRSLVKP